MDDEQCQEGSETSNKNIWTVNGYIFIGNYQGKQYLNMSLGENLNIKKKKMVLYLKFTEAF